MDLATVLAPLGLAQVAIICCYVVSLCIGAYIDIEYAQRAARVLITNITSQHGKPSSK